MGGGGGDGVTDTRTQKAEETKGLQSSEWPRPHHSLLSLRGARCGSVSEDEPVALKKKNFPVLEPKCERLCRLRVLGDI